MLLTPQKALAGAGATRLCIGSNTVHILLEDEQQTNIPFISMIELVAIGVPKAGLRKVGVLVLRY